MSSYPTTRRRRMFPPVEERLAGHLTPSPCIRSPHVDSLCLEWTDSQLPKRPTDRPRIWWRGEFAVAARVAWELANGPIPDGAHVLHRCDNGSCCNADHLFVGTPADNIRDCIAKGRKPYAPNARLKPADVLEIRGHLASGETQDSIARRFGVSQSTITLISTGKTWGHVK